MFRPMCSWPWRMEGPVALRGRGWSGSPQAHHPLPGQVPRVPRAPLLAAGSWQQLTRRNWGFSQPSLHGGILGRLTHLGLEGGACGHEPSLKDPCPRERQEKQTVPQIMARHPVSKWPFPSSGSSAAGGSQVFSNQVPPSRASDMAEMSSSSLPIERRASRSQVPDPSPLPPSTPCTHLVGCRGRRQEPASQGSPPRCRQGWGAFRWCLRRGPRGTITQSLECHCM